MRHQTCVSAIFTTALIFGVPTTGFAKSEYVHKGNAFNFTIEIAGADTTDLATDKELRESGTTMVPALPSATSRDPLKPEAEAPPSQAVEEPQTLPANTAITQSPSSDPISAEDGKADTAPSANGIKTTDTPAPSSAATSVINDGMYVRLDTGFAFTNDPDGAGRNGTNRSTTIDDAAFVTAGVGMPLDTNIRGDLTITYRDSMDISGIDGIGNSVNGDVDSIDTMLSLYYDFKQVHDLVGSNKFTPYLGVGLGLSYLSASDLKTTGQATENDAYSIDLSYAGMAGITADLSDALSIDVGYRVINLGQFEHDGTFSDGTRSTATEYDDLLSHELRAGIRLHF